jgi:hypothetical protein
MLAHERDGIVVHHISSRGRVLMYKTVLFRA